MSIKLLQTFTHWTIYWHKNLFLLNLKNIDDYFLHNKGGCLFGNLALELASGKESFNKETAKQKVRMAENVWNGKNP